MKNLKKALVLVLAFAMVFGMFTMNASAASFSDDDAIVNTEAVEAMAELGIVNGYEDGTFLPTQVVTRAEMCKMICVALNGGNAPLLGSSAAMFSDTVGHWANSYINYCYSAGIVSGDAGKGGAFRPDATVTAIEAAKMMLVALGYNSAVAGYTGAEWANNVAMDANRKNLFENIGSVNAAAGLTRDNAAQLIFNGMNAELVEYTNNYVLGPDGNLVPSPTVKDQENKTILSEKFRVKFDYGQVVSVGKETFKIEIDTTLGTSTTAPDAEGKVGYTKVTSDYSALLGQSVRVMFKGTDKVLGVVALENKVVTANASAVSKVSDTKVRIAGTEYTLDAATINTLTIGADGSIAAATADVDGLVAKTYNTIKLIDNDGDNKYEYAVITEVVPAKVTYKSSTEIIAGGKTYKYSSNDIEDGIAKDDYIVVVGNPYKGKSTITEVDMAFGKITGYKTGHEYQIDNGTWYKAASKFVNAGDNAKFIAVNGVIFYAAKADTASTSLDGVIMVLDADEDGVNRNAKILRADGTKAIVAIDLTATTPVKPVKGSLYTYTVTDNGYKFKDAGKIGNNTWYDATASSVAGTPITSIAGVGVADDAVIFVWDGKDNGMVITGKQLKKLDVGASGTGEAILAAGKGSFSGTSKGLTRIVMAGVVAAKDLPTITDTSNKYALVVSDSYQTDADHVTYEIFDGNSVTRVREKNDSATYKAKTVITYSSIVDGVIKDVKPATLKTAYVHGLTDDYVWLNGQEEGTNDYELTSKTVYMYYDSSAKAAADIGKPSGTLVLADKVVAGAYYENVKYIGTGGGDLDFILVDVKNKLSDAKTYTTTLTDSATRATVTFTDVNGDTLATGDKLAAGAIVTVEIECTDAGKVEVNLTNATIMGETYASGDDFEMTLGQIKTMTFVIKNDAGTTASIVVADVA